MTSPLCLFDDSLPWLVDVISKELGPELTVSGVFLRDASGRLAFFATQPLSSEEKIRISELARSRIGEYARPDRLLAGSDDSGATRVLEDPMVRTLDIAPLKVRYLDRRIVGTDWLRAPTDLRVRPPRIVFASLKGGVGRSTALSVVAAEQSRQGRNVLVVDLDIEAPGVGLYYLPTIASLRWERWTTSSRPT